MSETHIEKEFEMNIGDLCNFRCKYCFENTTRKQTTISWDILKRWAQYINYAKRKFYKNDSIKVTIFGGEPTLQIDNIDRFIGRVLHSVNKVCITTNASLPGDTKSKLLKLKRYKDFVKLVIIASYDFSNQNDNRHSDSYELVRNNIKWLYHNIGLRDCITVFSMNNFHKVHEVFFDYLELKKELPELKLHYNIDRYGYIPIDFDENPIRESLSKVKSYIDDNPNIKEDFNFNNCVGTKRSNLPEKYCFLHGIVISMINDGSLYPGYDTIYESDTVKNLLYIGNISESFDEIENKRRALIDKLPTNPNSRCVSCDSLCRIFPWRVMNTSLDEWNSLPIGGHCKLHKLFSEYLK